MKFTILGSCSGTEPMPGRRHESVILETGGKSYLFDAGDGCGYTAFQLGFDVTKLSSIFISHPHIDHVGGLAYLMFLMQKMKSMHAYTLTDPMYLYAPSRNIIEGIRLLNAVSESAVPKEITIRDVRDGLIYDDGTIRVTAKHNSHLGETGPVYHSYSYLIEETGKRAVYSGDVKSITELNDWLDADLLIMETGHHDPVEVAQYLANNEKTPKMLVFNHHGRKILSDPKGYLKKIRAVFGENAFIADDGTAYKI